MRRKEIHFKRKHPVRRFFHRLHLKWCLFWTPDRKNDLLVYIASSLFIGLMFFLFIMGD